MAEHIAVQEPQLPLLPTTVIGSYAYPSWLWTALEEMRQGKYGESDIDETLGDAVKMAIRDQEEAGIDIVNDGEMRRWYVFQSWYQRLSGLEPLEPLRKVGFYGHDSMARYRSVGRLAASRGLGIVDEYLYLKSHTKKPIKVTCTGPVTMTMPIELGAIYKDRIELAAEVAHVINAELKALVAAGASYIQIDEPSYALLPGSMKEWVNLFNEAIDGVKAKIALHICFGSVGGRPGGKRSYRWMVPQILDARADQFCPRVRQPRAQRAGAVPGVRRARRGRSWRSRREVVVRGNCRGNRRAAACGLGIRSCGKTLREPGLRFFSSAAKRCLTKNAQHGRWHVNRPRGDR